MIAQDFGCCPPHFLHHARLSLLDSRVRKPTCSAIRPLVNYYILLSRIFVVNPCLVIQDFQGANCCQRERCYSSSEPALICGLKGCHYSHGSMVGVIIDCEWCESDPAAAYMLFGCGNVSRQHTPSAFAPKHVTYIGSPQWLEDIIISLCLSSG